MGCSNSDKRPRLSRLASLTVTTAVMLKNAGMVEATTTPCTICADGVSSITLPDAEMEVPGFGFLTCSTIQTGISLLLPDDTVEDCQKLRAMSTLCGCPKPAGDNACDLCGSSLSQVPPSRSDATLPFLNHLFQGSDDTAVGATVTCGLLETYLYSVESDMPMCLSTQELLFDHCCIESLGTTANNNVMDQNDHNCKIQCEDNVTLSTSRDHEIRDEDWKDLFPTCQQVDEALTRSSMIIPNDRCTTIIQTDLASECCGAENRTRLPDDENDAALNDNNDNTAVVNVDSDSCSLCRDGSQVTLPDRTVAFAAEQFGFVPTCRQAETAVMVFDTDSTECQEAQQIGSYCGCPPIENACILCPNEGDKITDPDRLHVNTRERFGHNFTCSELELVLLQLDTNTHECFLAHETNWECGCNDGFYGFMGTERKSQKDLLSILSRISGSLSVMGALFIIVDFWRGDRQNIYRQIMLCMSCFDIITAMCWIIGSWPLPPLDADGNDANTLGANGSDELCTAQGFFVMLGYGSGFFNNSLSIYYILVVVRGWKGAKLQKAQKWLLGIPMVCALTLAFAGIPYYAPSWVACYIVPYPYNDSKEIYGFAIFPIILTSVVSTSCQIKVYLKVRAQLRTSLKWNVTKGLGNMRFNLSHPKLGGSKNNVNTEGGDQQETQKKPTASEKVRKSLNIRKSNLLSTNAEAAVFWQSFFYLLAYYTCWPMLMVAIITAQNQKFSFWAAFAFIGPLQGFLNCLVFVRPRLMKWRRERNKARVKLRKQEQRHKELQAAMDGAASNNHHTNNNMLANSRLPFPGLSQKSLNKSNFKSVLVNPSTASSMDRSSKTSRTESATDRFDESAGLTFVDPTTPMPPMPELDDNDDDEDEDDVIVIPVGDINPPECEEDSKRETEDDDLTKIYPSLI